MDAAATDPDPDLDAALARNLSMPEADRQRLAGAVAALHAARPRIVAQQAERVPGGADHLADIVLHHSRRALRRAAEQPDLPAALEALADGTIAQRLTLEGFTGSIPSDAACAAGCFFCCVFVDRASATEAEIRAVHAAIADLPVPDFHPDACPALDPETKACRAYEVRPLMCRDVTAPRVEPCERSYAAGHALPEAEFVKSGGELIFYGVNWLLVVLEAPDLLRIHDLKASLRAGGTPVPLP